MKCFKPAMSFWEWNAGRGFTVPDPSPSGGVNQGGHPAARRGVRHRIGRGLKRRLQACSPSRTGTARPISAIWPDLGRDRMMSQLGRTMSWHLIVLSCDPDSHSEFVRTCATTSRIASITS
jgi:hypothetical protein